MAYTKTPVGQLAFKERSQLLSNRQRSLFLLFDGVKPVDQVLAITKALNITQADIDHLVANGFVVNTVDVAAPVARTEPLVIPVAIDPAQISDHAGAPAFGDVAATAYTPQQRFAKAWPIATQLTAGMGLRGFRLNLSIEKASGYDDLLKLLPKIQEAVGTEKCVALARALSGH